MRIVLLDIEGGIGNVSRCTLRPECTADRLAINLFARSTINIVVVDDRSVYNTTSQLRNATPAFITAEAGTSAAVRLASISVYNNHDRQMIVNYSVFLAA